MAIGRGDPVRIFSRVTVIALHAFLSFLAFLAFLALPEVGTAFAESRCGTPYTPQQLREMSDLVFEGTVVKVETIQGRAHPVQAAVGRVLKGELDEKTLSFAHKVPGKHAIIEEEYNASEVGQEGVFYLAGDRPSLLLIGYIRMEKAPDLSRWISRILLRIQDVKAGSTRGDLKKVFDTEGGLCTGLRRTYVYRECRLIKVDVEFEPVGRAPHAGNGKVTLVESDDDVVKQISRPYLAWEVID